MENSEEEIEVEEQEEIEEEIEEEVEDNTEGENRNSQQNNDNISKIDRLKNDINNVKINSEPKAEKLNMNIMNNNEEIENEDYINEKFNHKNDEKYYIEELMKVIDDKEIYDLLESKRWENKKNGFVKLNTYLPNINYDKNKIKIILMFIFSKLNYFKETNFNIIKEGIQCIISIFDCINKSDKKILCEKQYLSIIINGLYEKITDNKIKQIYLKLLEELENSYSYKEILDILYDILKDINKNNILKEYLIYLKYLLENKKILEDYIETINLQNMIKFTSKLSNNNNLEIRDNAINILCILYKYIGPSLKLFLNEIKNESSLKKIEKEFSKIDFKNNNNNANNDKILDLLNLKKNNNHQNDVIEIPYSIFKMINRGTWNKKKEAIDFIHSLLNNKNNNISLNSLNNLFNLIKEKLKDGNKNLVKLIIELLWHLLDSLGEQIKNYSEEIIPSLISNLSEKNISLREECIKCIKKWIKIQDFKVFCYNFPQFLINDNYEMRNSILDLMIEDCSLIRKHYKQKFFDDITKSILICLQDKNYLIRNKTEEFMKKFDLINKEEYIKKAEDFKPEKCKYLLNIINSIFGGEDEEKNIEKVSPIKNIYTNKEHKNKNLFLNSERSNKTSSINDNNKRLNTTYLVRNKKNNISLDFSKNMNSSIRSRINEEIFGKTSRSKDAKRKDISFKKNYGSTSKNKNANDIVFGKIYTEKTIKNVYKRQQILNLECNNFSINKRRNKKNKELKNPNSIRLNLTNTKKIKYQSMNTTNNNSFITPIPMNSAIYKISNSKSIKVFLDIYKINKSSKEKRYEMDKKNNYLFEKNNFQYLKKIKEISKTIFSPEFYKKLFSSDLDQIIFCINQLKNDIEKNNNKNDEISKIIENIDIILKIIRYVFNSNQSSSLVKNFFEFSESLIEYYTKENICFNIVESTILINIFCDKLIFSNNKLSNLAKDLILKISSLIGNNKSILLLSHLIRHKNNKLKSKIFDIISNIYENSEIDNNTISKILKNILNLYFESDLAIKNKIIILLKKIYSKFGEECFNESIKMLSSKQKEEINIKIMNKNESNIKEKTPNKDIRNKKRIANSEQKRKRHNKNKIGEKSDGKSDKKNNYINNNQVINKNLNNINLTIFQTNKILNISLNDIKNKGHQKNYSFIIKDKINKDIISKIRKDKNICNSVHHKKKENNSNLNESIKINANHRKNNSVIKRNIKNNNKFLINLKNNCDSNIININSEKPKNKIKGKILMKNNLEELLQSLYDSAQFDDPKKKMECIINVHDLIYTNFSSNKNMLIDKDDIIINSLVNSIKKYFELISTDIISLKYLTNTFFLICSKKDLLCNISLETEEKLISLMLYIVTFKNLKNMGENNEGLLIWRSYNSIILRIIEYCNPTYTINSFIKQIINNEENNNTYNEYCSRCLQIISNNMKEIHDKIIVPDILMEVNNYFINFKINEEKLNDKNMGDMNHLTVIKKLICEIVKFKKEKIYEDYNNYINNIIKDNNNKVNDNSLIKLLIDENIKNVK